jgi:hypothetical protein
MAALARFGDGDLSQRKAARVGGHLAGCTRCANLRAELANVTATLASVPTPAMPEHLAARISDTLATEAARRVADGPGTEPGRRELPERTAGPLHRQRRPPLRPLRLSSPVVLRTLAAAGVIAVVAGGTYAITRQQSGSSSSPSATLGPAAGPGIRAAPAGRLPVAGPELRYGRHDSIVPVASGTNFVPERLAMQVSTVLSQAEAKRGAAPDLAPNATSAAAGNSSHASPTYPGTSQYGPLAAATLAACVGRIAAGDRVLLVDVARYQGGPATVIVTALPGTTASRAWVVGPACSGSRRDVLAQREIPAS